MGLYFFVKVFSFFLAYVKTMCLVCVHKIQTLMKTEQILKNTIETKLNKVVNFVKASDGANLLYTAKINDLTVANVYKSYDENFNVITLIKYNNEAL